MSREVEEIKQRLDIVEVIQQYLPLKKAGANHKGVCPFHQEKSPSFMVSQGKQIWHCFGCHEGGDVFTFVQKMEGLDFFETLKMLGERAGVKIDTKVRPEQASKKNRLADVLQQTQDFYHKILLEHPKAAEARAYAQSRHLQPETIAAFTLGYAPDVWDVLTTFLRKRAFTEQEMVEAGVVIYNQDRRSYYDRFRGRLMIPLRDPQGRTVGFTARAIAKDFEGGKYINTPQTELYDKSRLVFALDAAKQAIKQAGHVVVVEGNMDAISSHQAGIKQVVAVSGTALTEAQLGIIKRFTTTVIFSFDADAAGLMAARRGMELALRAGFTVKALTLPFGKDPDECIQKDPALWSQAIAQAKPVMDMVIARALAAHDARTPEGKKAISADVLSMLRHIANPVEVEHYLRILGDELQTSRETLQAVMRSLSAPASNQPAKQPVAPDSSKPKAHVAAPSDEAVMEVMALYIAYPALLEITPLADLTLVNRPDWQDLYTAVKTLYDESTSTGASPLPYQAFIHRLEPHLQTEFARLQLFSDKQFAELTGPEATQALGARLAFLKRKQLDEQLHARSLELKHAEQQNNTADIGRITQSITEILSQRAQLDS